MMAEIAANGPIGCGIQATDEFEKYSGDYIYSEYIENIELNHEIAVVGYGEDSLTGEKYWIGRNSWGTYWGDYGFFKMTMYGNNLGIDQDCTAGIPTFTKPSADVFVQ